MCNFLNDEKYSLIVPPDIARKVINESDGIYLNQCHCRVHKGNCEQEETEVCLMFADATEEDLEGARLIPKEQALSILEKARNRGDINHLIYSQNNKKFMELCNCCTCYCMILEDMAKDGDFTNFKGTGHIVETNHETCNLCGECMDK